MATKEIKLLGGQNYTISAEAKEGNYIFALLRLIQEEPEDIEIAIPDDDITDVVRYTSEDGKLNEGRIKSFNYETSTTNYGNMYQTGLDYACQKFTPEYKYKVTFGILEYSVSYDKNAEDATGFMQDDIVTSGNSDIVRDCSYSRTDYIFDSWNTKSDGSGETIAVGNTLSDIRKDITLYAQWRENTTENVTITFESLGHGELSGQTTFYVPKGTRFEDIHFPTTIPDEHYFFYKWEILDEDSEPVLILPQTINENYNIYANFQLKYLAITAQEGNVILNLNLIRQDWTDYMNYTKKIKYCTNLSNPNWQEFEFDFYNPTKTWTLANLGSTVYIMLTYDGSPYLSEDNENYFQFEIYNQKNVNVWGSLYYTLTPYCYARLFENMYGILYIGDLILAQETLAEGCYYQTFKGCQQIHSSPENNAKVLALNCFYQMYQDCSSLESVLLDNYSGTDLRQGNASNYSYQWLNGIYTNLSVYLRSLTFGTQPPYNLELGDNGLPQGGTGYFYDYPGGYTNLIM